jgi:predicted DNA-binding antitoxin AbrB/MazE fold protein
MSFVGEVKNGVIILEEGVSLPEGARVRVEVLEADDTSLVQGLLALAGKAEGLPPDLAKNHDHYLHGQPKK